MRFFDTNVLVVMVAAAKKLGCHEIVTEDLNEGQIYCDMVVVNPFRQLL
jgi:predicted nucleic acid-binding protein